METEFHSSRGKKAFAVPRLSCSLCWHCLNGRFTVGEKGYLSRFDVFPYSPRQDICAAPSISSSNQPAPSDRGRQNGSDIQMLLPADPSQPFVPPSMHGAASAAATAAACVGEQNQIGRIILDIHGAIMVWNSFRRRVPTERAGISGDCAKRRRRRNISPPLRLLIAFSSSLADTDADDVRSPFKHSDTTFEFQISSERRDLSRRRDPSRSERADMQAAAAAAATSCMGSIYLAGSGRNRRTPRISVGRSDI